MFPWTLYRDLNWFFPFSGDVAQRIEPETDWFFGNISPQAGDGDIEKEVFSKIASYGKQLGILADVVLALAEKSGAKKLDDLPALKQLRELHQSVEDLKAQKKQNVRKQAEKTLEKLARDDPETLEQLLKKYA